MSKKLQVPNTQLRSSEIELILERSFIDDWIEGSKKYVAGKRDKLLKKAWDGSRKAAVNTGGKLFLRSLEKLGVKAAGEKADLLDQAKELTQIYRDNRHNANQTNIQLIKSMNKLSILGDYLSEITTNKNFLERIDNLLQSQFDPESQVLLKDIKKSFKERHGYIATANNAREKLRTPLFKPLFDVDFLRNDFQRDILPLKSAGLILVDTPEEEAKAKDEIQKKRRPTQLKPELDWKKDPTSNHFRSITDLTVMKNWLEQDINQKDPQKVQKAKEFTTEINARTSGATRGNQQDTNESYQPELFEELFDHYVAKKKIKILEAEDRSEYEEDEDGNVSSDEEVDSNIASELKQEYQEFSKNISEVQEGFENFLTKDFPQHVENAVKNWRKQISDNSKDKEQDSLLTVAVGNSKRVVKLADEIANEYRIIHGNLTTKSSVQKLLPGISSLLSKVTAQVKNLKSGNNLNNRINANSVRPDDKNLSPYVQSILHEIFIMHGVSLLLFDSYVRDSLSDLDDFFTTNNTPLLKKSIKAERTPFRKLLSVLEKYNKFVSEFSQHTQNLGSNKEVHKLYNFLYDHLYLVKAGENPEDKDEGLFHAAVSHAADKNKKESYEHIKGFADYLGNLLKRNYQEFDDLSKQKLDSLEGRTAFDIRKIDRDRKAAMFSWGPHPELQDKKDSDLNRYKDNPNFSWQKFIEDKHLYFKNPELYGKQTPDHVIRYIQSLSLEQKQNKWEQYLASKNKVSTEEGEKSVPVIDHLKNDKIIEYINENKVVFYTTRTTWAKLRNKWKEKRKQVYNHIERTRYYKFEDLLGKINKNIAPVSINRNIVAFELPHINIYHIAKLLKSEESSEEDINLTIDLDILAFVADNYNLFEKIVKGNKRSLFIYEQNEDFQNKNLLKALTNIATILDTLQRSYELAKKISKFELMRDLTNRESEFFKKLESDINENKVKEEVRTLIADFNKIIKGLEKQQTSSMIKLNILATLFYNQDNKGNTLVQNYAKDIVSESSIESSDSQIRMLKSSSRSMKSKVEGRDRFLSAEQKWRHRKETIEKILDDTDQIKAMAKEREERNKNNAFSYEAPSLNEYKYKPLVDLLKDFYTHLGRTTARGIKSLSSYNKTLSRFKRFHDIPQTFSLTSFQKVITDGEYPDKPNDIQDYAPRKEYDQKQKELIHKKEDLEKITNSETNLLHSWEDLDGEFKSLYDLDKGEKEANQRIWDTILKLQRQNENFKRLNPINRKSFISILIPLLKALLEYSRQSATLLSFADQFMTLHSKDIMPLLRYRQSDPNHGQSPLKSRSAISTEKWKNYNNIMKTLTGGIDSDGTESKNSIVEKLGKEPNDNTGSLHSDEYLDYLNSDEVNLGFFNGIDVNKLDLEKLNKNIDDIEFFFHKMNPDLNMLYLDMSQKKNESDEEFEERKEKITKLIETYQKKYEDEILLIKNFISKIKDKDIEMPLEKFYQSDPYYKKIGTYIKDEIKGLSNHQKDSLIIICCSVAEILSIKNHDQRDDKQKTVKLDEEKIRRILIDFVHRLVGKDKGDNVNDAKHILKEYFRKYKAQVSVNESFASIRWRKNPRTHLNKVTMVCKNNEYKKSLNREINIAGQKVKETMCLPKSAKPAVEKAKDRKSSLKRWKTVRSNPGKMKIAKMKRNLTRKYSKTLR